MCASERDSRANSTLLRLLRFTALELVFTNGHSVARRHVPDGKRKGLVGTRQPTAARGRATASAWPNTHTNTCAWDVHVALAHKSATGCGFGRQTLANAPCNRGCVIDVLGCLLGTHVIATSRWPSLAATLLKATLLQCLSDARSLLSGRTPRRRAPLQWIAEWPTPWAHTHPSKLTRRPRLQQSDNHEAGGRKRHPPFTLGHFEITGSL